MKTKLCILTNTIVLFMVCTLSAFADERPSIRIKLLVDTPEVTEYQRLVRNDINALMDARYRIEYSVEKLNGATRDELVLQLEKIMDDDSLGCVISLGLAATEAVIQLKKYPRPTIAGAVLDHKLQGLSINIHGSSGIENFNYIQSPFDIEKDLSTFKNLYDYKHIAILYNANETFMFHTLYSYFGKMVGTLAKGTKLSMVEVYPEDIEKSIDSIPTGADSVYLPPLLIGGSGEKTQKVISLLNARKYPTFALLGEKSVKMGALASIAPERNINGISRRIAINVLDIASGRNAGELPVQVSNYVDNFVVNVATMRKINYFPRWEVLNDARLINYTTETRGKKIGLVDVIQEALQANLILQIEKLNTTIQEKEVGGAKSALLPQLSLSSSYTMLDKNRAEGSAGSPPRSSLSATGSITQSLFSDDNWATYSINKTLLESQQYVEKTQTYDTIINAAEAYINLLFARSDQVIQNNNLAVTRKNLSIAKSKEAVGSVGASEVHRWESEQAVNQISLNDAYRNIQLARLSLNRLLNRSIHEPLNAEDIEIKSSIELLITDEEVYRYLENMQQLAYFNDFLITEADRNLPELKEIEATLRSLKREVLNRERAFYLPDVQLQGQVDQVLGEYGTDFETPSDLDHPWSLTAVASWPLYTGSARRYDLAKSKLRLRQTKLQANDLRTELHLQVSSNLETAAVSAREVELSKKGLVSASKNFEIIQAGYSEGRNSIADLIDAQNAKTNAERGEAVAKYQFVLDFLILERSVGRFHFLGSPQEKADFIGRLQSYMESRK